MYPNATDKSPRLHVVAAAIFNAAGEVLVARRPPHLHQGGLWEFPGGKVEPNEAASAALARELHEELGITPTATRPLIQVRHDYPDRSVLLDVWRVDAFEGVAHGREGQPLRWVAPDALPELSFPAANLPIVTAVRLPSLYLITGEIPTGATGFERMLERALASGVRLVQLRAPHLDRQAFADLARGALPLCRGHGARLLLNTEPALVEEIGADGVHLTAARLMASTARPLPAALWVAASCHNAEELAHAVRIGVDFAVLGPVAPTATHPGARPLGWDGFAALAVPAALPVYALGGMRRADLDTAIRHGAQGIAAIRDLWQGGES